jgi:hypothetical protein
VSRDEKIGKGGIWADSYAGFWRLVDHVVLAETARAEAKADDGSKIA